MAKPLLTLNGIPPQVIGDLNAEAQKRAINWRPDTVRRRWELRDRHPVAIGSFAAVTLKVVKSFKEWGASIEGYNRVEFVADDLEKGDTTFQPCRAPHMDDLLAMSRLEVEDSLDLRLLCVSSNPARFLDLTGQRHMHDLIASCQPNDDRFLDEFLFRYAKRRGLQLRPHCWDIMLFDSATPHAPLLAQRPHRRVLQHAWVEIQLPENWRDRVRAGDVPVLKL